MQFKEDTLSYYLGLLQDGMSPSKVLAKAYESGMSSSDLSRLEKECGL
jgi:hypothetical protein